MKGSPMTDPLAIFDHAPADLYAGVYDGAEALKVLRFQTNPESAGEYAPCTIPPEGWRCTRAAGHEGPCAAIEGDDLSLKDRLGIEIAFCRHVGLTTTAEAARIIAFLSTNEARTR